MINTVALAYHAQIAKIEKRTWQDKNNIPFQMCDRSYCIDCKEIRHRIWHLNMSFNRRGLR